MSYGNRDEDSAVKEPEALETNEGGPEAMRPIPDGGLQQSMPEWLRRPPAWRNLPKKETPTANTAQASSSPSGSTADSVQLPAQAAAPLPDPDTSEIDPRSLVDVCDLPQWLQDIVARESATTDPPEQSAPPVTTDHPDEPKETDMTDPEKRLEHEPNPERTVAFEPVDKKKWEVPEQETKVYDGRPKQGMSPQVMILLGIAVLAILLIILIIVL
jgi:hypothetical protein